MYIIYYSILRYNTLDKITLRYSLARGHILLRKELGPYHIAKRICLERLKDVILEGSCLGSLGANLVPLNIVV
jgi:hypothetical protein